jgi:paraquat-inducible protein B
LSLGGLSSIITVELSKIGKIAKKPVQEMSPTERWAVFFRYCEDRKKRELVNEILTEEEGIAMAGETLATITKEEAERWREMSRLKYELDRQAAQKAMREKVRKEMRVEFREEIQKEVRDEVRKEVRAEVQREVRAEIQAEVRNEMRGKVREEVRTEGTLEVARKMKAGGVSPEQIRLYTGLSPEDIAGLC